MDTARTHPETEGDAEMNQMSRPVQGELILPRHKNEGAELVCNLQREIRTQIPPHVDQQTFLAACVVEANKLPADTQPASVAIAVMNLGVLGLVPGEILGHAFLVAYNMTVNRRTGEKRRLAKVMIGYKGFVELALGNSFLRNVHAGVATSSEEFRHWVNTDGPQIHHEPALDRDPQEQDIVAAYCTYTTSTGGKGVVVVPRRELQKAKAKNADSDPWKYSYAAMAAKTAIRRASKEWRLTRSLAQAVLIDEEAERGAVQTQLANITLPPMAPDQAPAAPKVGTRTERQNAVTEDDIEAVGQRWHSAAADRDQPTDKRAWKQFVRSCTDLPGDRITQTDCWTQEDLAAVRAGVERMEQEAAV